VTHVHGEGVAGEDSAAARVRRRPVRAHAPPAPTLVAHRVGEGARAARVRHVASAQANGQVGVRFCFFN
jgi:hypothetical protein